MQKREIKVTYPEEIAQSTDRVKKLYAEWVEVSHKLENHKLRYYTISDESGETYTLDCLGVWTNIFKKMDKLGGAQPKDYEEVKRRCKVIHVLKIQKGRLGVQWGAALDRDRGSVLNFRKKEILDLFGEYKTVDQVHETIKEWGYSASKVNLTQFYYENKSEIDDRRFRFVASEKDYYLATGTGRVQSLSYLYTVLMKEFEKTKAVRHSAEIRNIIEQVRKEVKGDEIRLTVDGKIDVTASFNANLTLQELNQKVSINSFIVALVAAKRGIDPMPLMAQLTSSFYKDYNGFSEIKEDKIIELPSHFIKSYDWNAIENIHTDKEKKATQKVLENKLRKFFSDNDITYKGNIHESIRELEKSLEGRVVPEIVDVEVLETESTVDVSDKRELLKQILEEKKKSIS